MAAEFVIMAMWENPNENMIEKANPLPFVSLSGCMLPKVSTPIHTHKNGIESPGKKSMRFSRIRDTKKDTKKALGLPKNCPVSAEFSNKKHQIHICRHHTPYYMQHNNILCRKSIFISCFGNENELWGQLC